jgi:hypothetical protein
LTIYQICERRPEIYGKRSDPIRKQIQQKVHHWRRKALKGTYESLVLKPLGVLSFAQQEILNENSNLKSDSESSESSDSSSIVSKESSKEESPPKRCKSENPQESDWKNSPAQNPPAEVAFRADTTAWNNPPALKEKQDKMAAVPESWGKLKSSRTTISLRVCTNRRVSFSSPHRQYRLP